MCRNPAWCEYVVDLAITLIRSGEDMIAGKLLPKTLENSAETISSTRREFLALSGSLLLTPSMTLWASADQPPSKPVMANAETPWREPGQVKDPEYLRTAAPRYSAEGREIIGRNRTCFNNRPLYCEPQTECVVLAGDRPFLRLLAEPYVLGSFSAAILRDSDGKWLHDCSEIESRYRCGCMTWHILDTAYDGLNISLTAVPLQGAGGFALRLRAQGLQQGDRLLWAFGGAVYEKDVRLNWEPVWRGNPDLYRTGDPRKPQASIGMRRADCRRNRAFVDESGFRLLATEGASRFAAGKCDRAGRVQIVDASTYSNPAALWESAAARLPLVCGMIDLATQTDEVFWMVEADTPGSPLGIGHRNTASEGFQKGMAYLQAIERVQIDTPDPRLDAAIASVCHPIDAACERDPYRFWHGCMAWSVPILGWRVMSGAIALGWHERLRGTAAHYAAYQTQHSNGCEQPQSDPTMKYCVEGPQSRFWGRGRLSPQHEGRGFVYNTQTQFFDQLIRDWRWMADPQMEKILRPMPRAAFGLVA